MIFFIILACIATVCTKSSFSTLTTLEYVAQQKTFYEDLEKEFETFVILFPPNDVKHAMRPWLVAQILDLRNRCVALTFFVWLFVALENSNKRFLSA